MLGLSIGLNGVLAAGWYFTARRAALPVTTAGVEAPAATNRLAGRTHVVYRRQVFSWREVESPDYATYIDRLRDIGCPEPTIRDIIVADVNQLYARKRLAETPPLDFEWWRTTPDPNQQELAQVKLAALEQERRTVLTELLGPDWETPTPGSAERPLVSLTGPVLGDLPPETKEAVEGIVRGSQERVDAYVAQRRGAGLGVEPAELARIRLAARGELAAVLAPPQLEEFLLRYSQTAVTLRQNFAGLQLAPEEFRKVFRAVDPLDQQLQLAAGATNAAALAQRDLWEKRRDEAIRAALGADRAAQYVAARDRAASLDAGGDGETIGAEAAPANGTLPATLAALSQVTAREIERIRQDPNLTEEQRAAQIRSTLEQLQTARSQVLGTAAATPPPPAAAGAVHTFSPGETLDGIAGQYGVSIGNLLQANPALNLNQLSKGMQLRIPVAAR